MGKAGAAGGRKGLAQDFGEATRRVIYNRLNKHRASIDNAVNLEVGDFHARWLIVEPIWIPLTESILINRSACVWNSVLDGFGNNDPGKERASGQRTRWDTVHPGRHYAVGAPGRKQDTAESLVQDAQTWIAQRI